MDIFGFVSSIFEPVSKIVDDVHTSEEERLESQRKLLKVKNELLKQADEFEKQLLESKKEVLVSEIKGESWLQRSWRPLMMLWFAILLGMYWFGITPENLSQETINKLFDLLQIGIGGYLVGRTVEKVTPQVVSGIKSK